MQTINKEELPIRRFNMPTKTPIDLNSTFNLIQKIKIGINQKCYVEISNIDVNASNRGLRILIQTKNYKTGMYMYSEKIVPEQELITLKPSLYDNMINNFIKEANYYFRKEQTKGICEECGVPLSKKEINEGITICEECAIGLHGYAAECEKKYNK